MNTRDTTGRPVSPTVGGRFPGMRRDSSRSPAVSNDGQTWPDHWPDRPADWDGWWNGYFGKGVQNADLETYFVYDDDEDREYLLRYNLPAGCR